MHSRLIGGAMLLSALAASPLCLAQNNPSSPAGLSYTYAGIQFVDQSLDDGGFDCDQDGLNLHGSLDLKNNWFVAGSFTDVSGDFCGSSSFQFGGGYRTAYNEVFDVYGAIAFQSVSPDHGSSDSGLGLEAGMRGFLKPQLETRFGVFHSTTYEQTGVFGGLAYWFQPNIAGTFDLNFSADVTAFAIGARMNF